MSKRDRRDLNHLLSLTCQKLSSKMTPTDLLYREAPERAAQKAQDSLDTSDKSAKMVSFCNLFMPILIYCHLNYPMTSETGSKI